VNNNGSPQVKNPSSSDDDEPKEIENTFGLSASKDISK
jgi:hypothetical protein